MCFSATASFTASAVLGASGAVTLSRVKTKRDYFLASVPVLFAVQQFLEGLVWITIGRGLITESFAYGFLFFAFILWPTYIPLAVLMHETRPRRRHLLKHLFFLGTLGSFYLLVILLTQPLTVALEASRICYQVPTPVDIPGVILYVAVTMGAFLVSSDRWIRWFGALTFLSALIAWIFYRAAFTSVWCFFAAVLSLMLVVFFLKRRRPRP